MDLHDWIGIHTERTQISHTRRKDDQTAKTMKIAHKRAEALADKPVIVYLCEVLKDIAWNNEKLTLNFLISR